jgi:hypothetical protein
MSCNTRPTPWAGPAIVAPAPAVDPTVVVVGPPPVQATPAPAPTVAIVTPAPAPAAAPAPFVQLPSPVLSYRRPAGRIPTYARAAGKAWSQKEEELVSHAFRTAGLQAAYNAVPHRTKPAVRGWLQRNGYIAKALPTVNTP